MPRRGDWAGRQLTELLGDAVGLSEERSLVRVALERATRALDAEVGAFVRAGAVAGAVDHASGGVRERALVAAAGRGRGGFDLPGCARGHVAVVPVEREPVSSLVVVRREPAPFGSEELGLLDGMARVLCLSLQSLRSLERERALRSESETEVEERKRAERELGREREFLGAVLESTEEGVVACDPDGVLMLFNRATREMHGLTEEDLPTEEWAVRYDLYMPDGRTRMPTQQIPLLRALRGELVRAAEMVIAPKSLPPRRVIVNGQRLEAEDGRGLGAVVTMHDVTGRRRAEDELAHQALHDRLTGLPNRALLLDRVEHALALSRRSGAGVAVLFADLDDFKLVNDSLGHRAGDQLLVAVADRLREVTRSSDTTARPTGETIARLGGDEFVVLCEGLRSEHNAITIAERIAGALEPPFAIEDQRLFVSASVGIAIGERDSTPQSLLRDADTAVCRAKERGRGRYELFDEELRGRLIDRLQREKELREAIDRHELRLVYQPIVSLPDRRTVGVEALVRWQHPSRGLLQPSQFIELAEESGLIVPLGNWVLAEACRQIAEWERSLGDRPAPRVSVNLSPRQLASPRILAEVRRALDDAGADPARLALEITETALMEDGRAPVAILEELGALGISLLLDDFGTGYSSLSYLQRLPLDALKLDRSFVTGLQPAGDERNIARAVVEMARALRMSLVAEGVETDEQLEILEELGCHLAQGFYFAPPMPAGEMTDLLSAEHASSAA